MKLYTHVNFIAHYPVGGAAIIIAKGRKSALNLLYKELEKCGLQEKNKDLVKLSDGLVEVKDLNVPQAIILDDGDY